MNGARISNLLTEDVVKIKEFSKPGEINQPDIPVDCDDLPSGVDFTFEDISRAVQAQADAIKGISLSNNGETSLLSFTSPSPVYPDLIALPLMSQEKCYGPWLSTALSKKTAGGTIKKYGDIGGKIEFVKDEKLAPWNYAGFALMDEAAKLKTQFSNSLMLLTEKGSFTYPSEPIEITLAQALKDRGPLVTSVDVTVTNTSISTTVQLDLYTARFGKLQKQKEIAISQISRERQKMIDLNNHLVRRGIGKGQANMDLLGDLGEGLLDLASDSNSILSSFERGETPKPSMFTVSNTATDNVYIDSRGNETKVYNNSAEGVMQTEGQLREMEQIFNTQRQLDEARERAAGGGVSDVFKGYSHDQHNIYFASLGDETRVDRVNRKVLGQNQV